MQAFTPKKPTSDSGHPGDEELAAYVDGMLGEEDAARVAGHLAACADCYRVCSETLRFQLEEEEEEEEEETQEQEEKVAAAAAATVVPFPADRKVSPRWWLAAAAAVLVVGLGAGLFTLFGPVPEMTTAKLVAPLRGEPIHGTDLWTPRTRGGPGGGIALPPEELTDSRNMFGIGVQLVNLQVGLERNDPEVADAVLPLLLGLLEQELLIDPQFPKSFEDLGEALRKGEASPNLVQEASQKSEELREFLSPDPDPDLELGRFVETGRLAAIAGEPAFFKKWSTRRLLRSLLKQQEEGELSLPPEALESLKAISERLKEGDLQPSDYSTLREQFEVILKAYYPT